MSVESLAPFPVGLTLLAAAALVPLAFLRSRRLIDATALAAAVAVTVICGALLWQSTSGPFRYSFGGWGLRDGVPIGITFVVDPFGAALATLAAVLVVAALLFMWRHFETVGSHFHVLVLVVLAGMTGFAFTGDLFNMFVFFELLSIAAYALTGYEIERARPVEGALNFAVTNSLGAFLVLTGIALVYARTGALDLAQIGRELSRSGADGLVVVAFTLIVTGFLIKAAVVPFHFWLPDAYAVAPTPAIVLSASMVQLGLYAVARVYWVAFEASLGLAEVSVRQALVALGTVTALVGGCMCFAQEHVKRLLAFSTVSHTGLFLIGVGLLDPVGLAGAGFSVAAHGFVKAALFICSGVLVHRYGTVDENRLHGRARDLPVTGALFALGGLALAGLPPFGGYLGKALIEEASASVGYGWVTPLAVVTSALTGGAVLRVAGRVFRGWGPKDDEAFESHQAEDEKRETEEDRRVPRVMLAPAIGLLVAALAWGLVPGLVQRAEVAAEVFVDSETYASAALGRDTAIPAEPPPREAPAVSPVSAGVLSAVAALAVAALGLFRRRLVPATLRGWVAGAVKPGLSGLRDLHSGHVGDYVTWIVVGISLLGGWLALGRGS